MAAKPHYRAWVLGAAERAGKAGQRKLPPCQPRSSQPSPRSLKQTRKNCGRPYAPRCPLPQAMASSPPFSCNRAWLSKESRGRLSHPHAGQDKAPLPPDLIPQLSSLFWWKVTELNTIVRRITGSHQRYTDQLYPVGDGRYVRRSQQQSWHNHAAQVGRTPQGMEQERFFANQNLSETVMVPIAGWSLPSSCVMNWSYDGWHRRNDFPWVSGRLISLMSQDSRIYCGPLVTEYL